MVTPNIAILILAHKNNEQLKRLVNHLKKDFMLYIHIDKKSNIQVFKDKNVHSIKKYKVYWGSYSQILATRELMKIAANDKHNRYLLISGQDLPIKSNREIIKFFENNKLNYLEKIELPSSWWTNHLQGGLQKMRYYHFDYFNRRGTKLHEKIIRLIERKVHQMQDIFMFHRKTPDNLFGGSNWFNLTHEAIMACLEELYDQKFMKMFKYTKNGDEIIINTIIHNSKHAILCVNDHLRYVNWDEGNPKVLNFEDYNKIITSEKLFARKFDETVDSAIINEIYKIIS